MDALKTVKISVLIFISYIIQTTLLHSLKVHSIIPNLLVVVVVCFSLIETQGLVSAVLGLVCGLLLDITGGKAFGLSALLCMLLAYFCTVMSDKFFKGKFWVSMLFVLIAGFTYELLYYFLCFGMWAKANVFTSLIDVVIPTTIYNTGIAVPLFFFIKRLRLSRQ